MYNPIRLTEEELSQEVFVPIWWANTYQVSNMGRVKTSCGKIITGHSSNGYRRLVCMGRAGFIHILVATEFIPNPHNKPLVNHKDRNRGNAKASNLEWVTHKENSIHYIMAGGSPHAKPIEKIDIASNRVIATYPAILVACKKEKITRALLMELISGVKSHDGNYQTFRFSK